MSAQHESYASGMQPEWRSYFPSLSFEPHSGQRQTFEAATEDIAIDKLIVLPTGYGKTRAAAGYYAIARERGLVNRCLWIVSSDLQRLGLSPEPDQRTGERAKAVSDSIMDWFGLPCLETITVTGAWHEIKAHQQNLAEVFVTSYQFLRQQAVYFNALLETGDWYVIADEAHHLSVSGAWATWLERHRRVGTLYMSATPLRTDRLPLKNVPVTPDGKTFQARVRIPERDAIDEGAIRKPIAHAQEWELEFNDKAGKLVTYTTTQLRDLDIKEGDDFDAWVVRHDLKYTMTHLQHIIRDGIDRLNEKRATLPGPPQQMIVFAMSCGHAKFLASHVFPSLGYERGTGADWIGVTRSDAENRAVVQRYLSGRLPVLVQVDKAGEGFDNPPASVAVFLNMIRSDTKLLQQLGRVMRRIFEIPKDLDRAEVFADTSHGVIGLIHSMQPELERDPALRDPPEPCGGNDPQLDWPALPTLTEIQARWLKTDVFGPDGSVQQPPGVLQAARHFGMTPDAVQEIVRMATGHKVQAERPNGEVGQRALMEARVTSTTALIASHAIRIVSTHRRIVNEKQLAGWIKINLNYRWKRDARLGHKEMLSEDFARKYEWLREIDEDMRLTREVPSWLTEPRS